MNKVKNLLERVGTKAKFAVGTLAAAGTTAIATVAASAEEGLSPLKQYSTQITDQFTNTANDLVPMLATVLGSGLGIFGIFFGIKLVKKIFSTVSKG